MKIGFDAKRAFVNRSGLGNYSRDVITSLYDLYPENEYILFSPENTTSLLDKKYLENAISPGSSSRLVKSYWRSVVMGNDIRKISPDIFHGLSNELPSNIKKADVIKVVTIHDLIFLKYPSLYKFIDRKIYNKKFRRACVDSDKIIAISNQTKSDIINYYNIPGDKIEIIYQSCNPVFKVLLNDEDKGRIKTKYHLPDNFILSVGTVERRKNVLNVLKAINNHKIDINYVIVGRKTAYNNELTKYINDHGMNERIFVIDNISNEDLPSVYQLSKLFVYPSVYEGFGIPILEAFNSGTPVITSNIGATSEAGGDASVLIDPYDPEEIGHAIMSVLGNNKLRDELVSKGFERAKLFDREVVAENIMNFYKRL